MSKEMEAAAESEDFDQVLHRNCRVNNQYFTFVFFLPLHQAALLDENISVKNQELDLVRLLFQILLFNDRFKHQVFFFLLQLLSELGCERMDISNFCEEEA